MKKWIGNFRTVYRLLDKVLSEQGVTKIESLDQAFDPHWHKVVGTVVDPSKQDGTIVEETKRGYVWQNQILREAEVIVVRNREGVSELPTHRNRTASNGFPESKGSQAEEDFNGKPRAGTSEHDDTQV